MGKIGYLNHYNLKDLLFFYDGYEDKSPVDVIVYIIITCGLYAVYWLYKMNVHFEEIDEETPNPSRGVIILLFLPIFWLLSTFISISDI